MSEFESSCAHDSDDCPPDCPHPDHFYDGDEMTDEELYELRRRLADTGRGSYLTWEEAMHALGINESDLEGPVTL